ncbi:MAG: sodium-dependent transporter [Elusimicrobiota bacterium]
MELNQKRETWNTKIGLILAMAGNAIGLGNFLRFPVQAASNGGGAFMIPYFIALVFLAIPIMWAEWAMGRLGGSKGHGTMPGIFSMLWKHPAAKYIGILGILLPVSIVFYYIYIESWTFAYSVFSIFKSYFGNTSQETMKEFLSQYQRGGSFIGVSITAYVFFILVFAINIWVLSGGIAKGIEKLANIAMPILFIFAVFLMIKVFTIGTPNPDYPENNVLNGLGFIWNPDFSQLLNAKIWLAAAGQIFFTTSIASGAIHTYASYVRKNDDIALAGFTTVMTNEIAEVILGGSIAIPIAFAFFGHMQTVEIAKSGAFNLGFVAMPVIFQNLSFGSIMGTIWFLLLFLAGITSSVALIQPLISFLEDELDISRKKAVTISAIIIFIAASIIILGFNHGTVDELDFWVGTFGLSLFALIEIIIFVWIYGEKNAWEEIMRGSLIKVPVFFMFVLKYISPIFMLAIFIAWTYQGAWDIMTMKGVSDKDFIWRWIARIIIIAFAGILLFWVKKSKKLQTLGREE